LPAIRKWGCGMNDTLIHHARGTFAHRPVLASLQCEVAETIAAEHVEVAHPTGADSGEGSVAVRDSRRPVWSDEVVMAGDEPTFYDFRAEIHMQRERCVAGCSRREPPSCRQRSKRRPRYRRERAVDSRRVRIRAHPGRKRTRAANREVPAGNDLRGSIESWTAADTCGTEQRGSSAASRMGGDGWPAILRPAARVGRISRRCRLHEHRNAMNRQGRTNVERPEGSR